VAEKGPLRLCGGSVRDHHSSGKNQGELRTNQLQLTPAHDCERKRKFRVPRFVSDNQLISPARMAANSSIGVRVPPCSSVTGLSKATSRMKSPPRLKQRTTSVKSTWPTIRRTVIDPSSLINAERGPRPERDVDVLVILCVVSCPVAAEDFKTPGSGN